MPLSPRTRKARTQTEKRREARSRSRVPLTGRLYFPDRKIEEACEILDLSPSGAGLKTSASAPIGTRAVLYLDGFGTYEGTVVRRNRTELGMEFRCSEARRARTAEQIIAFLANGSRVSSGVRSTARVSRAHALHELVTLRGEHVHCEIVDIALGGVALKSSYRPMIGEIVRFGELSGKVLRLSSDGFVVGFSS